MSFTNRTTAAAKTEIPDGHISHSVFSELLTQDLSDLTLVGNTCTESSFMVFSEEKKKKKSAWHTRNPSQIPSAHSPEVPVVSYFGTRRVCGSASGPR